MSPHLSNPVSYTHLTGTDFTAQQSTYFKDMANHLWASASVDTLYEYGIVKGITADTYGPGRNISRADFVLLLMRTFNFSGDASTNFLSLIHIWS